MILTNVKIYRINLYKEILNNNNNKNSFYLEDFFDEKTNIGVKFSTYTKNFKFFEKY